jgi:serine/threonine protein kinase
VLPLGRLKLSSTTRGSFVSASVKKLGKYEIVAELGHGAMGVVYRARDPIINRLVALKTITARVAEDPDVLQRFYREAQSAGGLQHPNIITIHDMGEEGNTPYIAMELVEGENLDQLIARRAPLPVSLKLVYATQACRALDYAHKRGIVHRDIKPGNVMVSQEGTVKVVDFGIARVLEASKTQTGMLIGTFAYMSPEQYQGEHADERSDIWSFGVLLYELLCYQRPFIGDSPVSLLRSICEKEPEPLSKFLPDCPAELQDILSRALRKSASERYQSMGDLLLELDPLSKRLQAESVTELVDQGRRLVEQSQFTEARDLLRQALQFETGNQQVKSLLDKVNSELKRILVRPRVHEYVEKGRALLAEGKVQDARIAAASALQLDSSFEPAQELRQVVGKELERAELIAGWLKAAKHRIAEGLPDEAEALVAMVLAAEPSNEQASALQQQVIQEKADRQKRLRLLDRLQYARGLWTRQNYGECINLLVDLQKEFPEDEEVPALLETVREDQAERREQALLGCRNLLAARRYEECLTRLTSLQEQFPGDEEIPRLLEEVRREQKSQRRLQGVADAIGALAARRYDESISLLSALCREFPGEPELVSLLETARENQEEHQRQQSIAKAQELMAARRYEESIAALSQLHANFPTDAEIRDLLEIARRDQAEQQKQQKLANARSLLAVQSFEEALIVLDELAAAHPDDAAVVKLRALARREQEKHARTERVQRELEALKKLMGEKKYSEVVSEAKRLLTEFPGETSIRRLAEFAIGQQESDDKEILFHRTLEQARTLFDSNRFKEAIDIAQIGLKTFPANPDLLHLYQQAEIQQRKLEARQKIEERVREIRVKINREKFSDAINLAKQTLVTLGPDPKLTELLNTAEVEFEAREKKKEQGRTLQIIRTLIEAGNLEDASQMIDQGIKANALDTSDPRFQRLAAQLKDTESGKREESTPAPTLLPTTLEREYAFLPGSPSPPAPSLTEKTFLRQASTPQGAAAQPALESQKVVPITSPEDSSPLLSSMAAQQLEPMAVEVAEQEAISSGVSAPPIETPPPPSTDASASEAQAAAQPVLDSQAVVPTTSPEESPSHPSSTAAGPLAPVAVEPGEREAIPSGASAQSVKDLAPFSPAAAPVKAPATATISFWRRPAFIALMALGLIAAVSVGIYSFRVTTAPSSAKTGPQPARPQTNVLETPQREALNAAGQLIAANDLDGARKKLQEAAASNGPLTPEIQQRISAIDESSKDPNLRQLRRREEVIWQRAMKRVADGQYILARQELGQILALRLGGVHRSDAQEYLDKVIPQRVQENDLLAQAHLDMSQGDFQSARSIAEQLKQSGNTAPLSDQIDQAERSRLAQLEDQFNHLKGRDDDGSVQKLKALQQKFLALSSDGGPQSAEALSFANGIPGTIADVQARMQKKNAGRPVVPAETSAASASKAAIRAVIQRYVQAFERKDADALTKIWPTIGSSYDSYKSAFDAASSIHMQLNIRSVAVSTDDSTAIVEARVLQDYTAKGTSETKSSKHAITFELDKAEGDWLITDTQETDLPNN